MKAKLLLLLFFLLTVSSVAQHVANDAPIRYVSTLPLTCSPTSLSQVLVYKFTAPRGLYVCSATNTWTLVGSGGGSASWGSIGGTLSSQADLQSALNAKQAALICGTSLKTINSNCLLGAGDIAIAGGSGVTLANTYGNSLATAISAIGSTPTTLVYDTNTTVTTGLTVPSTLTLQPTNGATITVSGAGSIQFSGQGLANPLEPRAAIKITSTIANLATRDFLTDTTNDKFINQTHGYTTGQRLRFVVTAGSAPGGLTTNGVYYAIVVASDQFKVASSYANAIANTPIDITSTGGGGAEGFFYSQPLEWTGGKPSQISTEIIDTNTDSVTDRLKMLYSAFWSNAVTFVASPRPITSYIFFQDRHSVWFTSGDYINTYTPVDSVNVPFIMASYSSFKSDGSARLYTSTDAIDNCNVVSTKYHSTHILIEGIHFMHGGGTDLGGNQTVAALYETSYSTIRNNIFDQTQAYAAGIIGNRQNFTDSVPMYDTIENNVAIGYGTQVFYIISGKTLKIVDNKAYLSDAVGGGQFATIDLEPNTQYDYVEDVEIARNYLDIRNQFIVNRGIEIQSSSGRGIRRLNIHHNTIIVDSEDETAASLTLAGIEILGGRDIDIDDNEFYGSMFGQVVVKQARAVNVRRNHAHAIVTGSARIQIFGCADCIVSDNILNESGALMANGSPQGQVIENGEVFVLFTSADGTTLDWPNNNAWAFDYYKGLTIWYNEIPHTITSVSTVQSDLFNKHITITPAISPVAVVNIVAASVNAGTDTITAPANHNLVTGDALLWSCSSCPGGLPFGEYYVISTGATTFKLATTHANALATTAIDITSSGSGTHTYQPEFRTNFTNVLYSGNYASAGDTGAGYALINYGASQILSTSTDRRITNVADTNYTAVHNDGIILYTSLTAGRTVTLPDPTVIRGKEFTIKDGTCSAGTNAISVTSAVGLVDGVSTFTMDTDCAFTRFKSTGTGYIALEYQ